MAQQTVGSLEFEFEGARPIQIEFSDSLLTTDAGLLLFRQLDERLRITEQFAAALHDERDPEQIVHSDLSMLRQRVYGILADYQDQNDHDTLRRDPAFKLLAGRNPDGLDLASQPTLSRFENGVSIADLWALRDVLVDIFIQSFAIPPTQITLDVDAFDDTTHGHQQLTLFHGFYDQYQYLPIIFTCAENKMPVLIGLRHGTAAASLGADDDIRYLVQRFRAVWPDVKIHLRGDSGYGVPIMYNVCEELEIYYTFGLAMNSVLKRLSDDLLQSAIQKYEQTGQEQRVFEQVDYQAGSWPQERPVVIKVEAQQAGTNRRAVVTNRPGVKVLPQGVYDEYAMRGESENRNKELKCGLQADRLSDHRFLANYLRLYLHTIAYLLLIRVRHVTVRPRPTTSSAGLVTNVPAAALPDPERRTFFNYRRQSDALGEGHIETWRSHIIKVAAEVIVSCRRIVIKLSSSWPHLPDFQRVLEAVRGLATPPSG